MARRPRRHFTPAFKAEVVDMIRTSGKSSRAICRDLDLSDTAVRTWVAQDSIDRAGSGTGPLTTAERTELDRLRRENTELRMERAIFKKARAFFAKYGA